MKKIFYALGSFLIAGAVMLGIGLFYTTVKAGIPYQDPPLELQIQYAVNMGVGNELLKVGAVLVCVSIVGRLIIRIIRKSQKNASGAQS